MTNDLRADLTACPLGEANCTIGETLNAMQQQIRELQRQVNTDPLTGLFNLRHLHFTLEQEMERTRRTQVPTTFVIVDADHFKSVNDTHGHIVGDHALQHIAAILRAEVRRLDVPCRYGGEEFAVVLPSTPLLVGVQVAERVRAKVEESPLLDRELRLPLSVSIGVASFAHRDAVSMEELIAEADRQLYHAKAGGRNRVCHRVESLQSRAAVSQGEKDALFDQLQNENDSQENPPC